jgi:hypothetical protein
VADDVIIDTNVWVMVDRVIDVGSLTLIEIDCIRACRNWLRAFADGEGKLVVDGFLTRRILTEYRRNIAPQGQAKDLLNRLEAMPRERLIEVEIAFDSNGHAVVPPELGAVDRSDRKFVAVALAHKPTPPIIDAIDTDWTKTQAELNATGITVIELCPDYLQEKLAQA